MNKIVLIFLISLCVSINLADRPNLRSYVWRPSQFLPILKEGLAPVWQTLESWNIIPLDNFPESDVLNQYAQDVAEQIGDPINFIDTYSKSSEHIVTYGFRIKGDVTLQTIVTSDPSGYNYFYKLYKFEYVLFFIFNILIVLREDMSAFFDFRHKGAKLNIVASEVRDIIKSGRCLLGLLENFNIQDQCKISKQSMFY